jgi:hypothetical protein
MGGLERPGLRLLALLHAGNFTGYGLVSLERFLFPAFPTGINGKSNKARLNTENERCLVLKADGDSVVAGVGKEFHAINDLVSDFGKALPCVFLWGVCTLNSSH